MKKYWMIVLVLLLVLVGCTNNSEKIKENVINGSYNEVFNKVSMLASEIQMFPARGNEEDFIYYVTAIRDNCKVYSDDEINDLYDLLNFEYRFTQNKIDYTYSDYQNDLMILKNCM